MSPVTLNADFIVLEIRSEYTTGRDRPQEHGLAERTQERSRHKELILDVWVCPIMEGGVVGQVLLNTPTGPHRYLQRIRETHSRAVHTLWILSAYWGLCRNLSRWNSRVIENVFSLYLVTVSLIVYPGWCFRNTDVPCLFLLDAC